MAGDPTRPGGALSGCRRDSIAEWRRLGVRTSTGGDLPSRDLMASIAQPDGPGGPAFMVYENYKKILRWNRSTFFATAVGELADYIDD